MILSVQHSLTAQYVHEDTANILLPVHSVYISVWVCVCANDDTTTQTVSSLALRITIYTRPSTFVICLHFAQVQRAPESAASHHNAAATT